MVKYSKSPGFYTTRDKNFRLIKRGEMITPIYPGENESKVVVLGSKHISGPRIHIY